MLILDEPTRGIDIGAKVEVHRIISELAARGLGILLISSDLPEVLAMSDRILVMHEGGVTAEIGRADATEEAVMFAATGQADGRAPGGRRACAEATPRSPRPPRLGRRRVLPAVARQRELSLVVVMVVLGVFVVIAGAPVPVGLQPDPGHDLASIIASPRSARRSSS